MLLQNIDETKSINLANLISEFEKLRLIPEWLPELNLDWVETMELGV